MAYVRGHRSVLIAMMAAVVASAGGCAPEGESGACSQTKACEGRGEVCDLMTSTCVQREFDPTSTQSPTPASFQNVVVPFFRGELCTVHEVQAGGTVPITMSPCFHPCLEVGSFKFRHFFNCIGSSCEAWATMWVVADSIPEGCPDDAFGQFNRNLCVFDNAVELGINTNLESGPIAGNMLLEVPYLSNEDAAAIAADEANQVLAEDRITQYVQLPNRIPDGRPISLLPTHPAPPAMCNGSENCQCFEIGF